MSEDHETFSPDTPPRPTEARREHESATIRKSVKSITEKTGVTMPIGIVLSIFAFVGGWLYTGLTKRVDTQQEIITLRGDRILRLELDSAYMHQAFDRVEAKLQAISDKFDASNKP